MTDFRAIKTLDDKILAFEQSAEIPLRTDGMEAHRLAGATDSGGQIPGVPTDDVRDGPGAIQYASVHAGELLFGERQRSTCEADDQPIRRDDPSPRTQEIAPP